MKNDDIQMKELQIYNLCAVIINWEHPCPQRNTKLFCDCKNAKAWTAKQLKSYEHRILMSIQTANNHWNKNGNFLFLCFPNIQIKRNSNRIQLI